MQEVLRKCIYNFGEPPRAVSLWDRLWYLRVPRPLWLWSNPPDRLATHFKNLNKLFCDGIVVWGHVVQANRRLFEKGLFNHPGEIVYSIDNTNLVEPEYLQRVAEQLYQLKNTKPTVPELRGISDYLTDERIRVFGLPVPYPISPWIPCTISTTYFVRKHLPKRQIRRLLIPVIVSRQRPHTATTLPERYWPSELVEWWSN